MWLPNLESRKGPVYRAIADAIDEDVQSGTLRAGSKLPPHRDLADHLGVTVTTITRAYTEAANCYVDPVYAEAIGAEKARKQRLRRPHYQRNLAFYL